MSPVDRNPRGAARVVSACFLVSTAAAIGLSVVYWRGGQPQLEGTFLGIAFGALGAGLVVWAHHLLPSDVHTEKREPLATTPEEQAEFAEELESGGLERRRKLASWPCADRTPRFMTAHSAFSCPRAPTPKRRRATFSGAADGE